MSFRFAYSARRLLLASLCAAMIAGCGTSESDSGGGKVAGIEGTGIVSGFGSVYVDGIEFTTNDADIRINDELANESDLRVGDVVTVQGRLDADGNARADRIVFDRNVDGPIDSLNLDDGVGELTALGQRVQITADTTFVNIEPQNLAANDLIAISGIAGDNATLRATSIRRGGRYVAGTTRIDVEGTVRGLAGTTFMLGSQSVTFGGAALDDSGGPLVNGAHVEVFGTRGAGAAAPLHADRINTGTPALGANGERVFIESLITNFNGLNDFRINGQRVNAADAQRADSSTTAPANGISASVRGVLRDGVLTADTLRINPVPTVTLQAPLSAINLSAGTFDVLNATAQVRPTTLYLDRSAANDRRLRIGRLGNGDTVNISGYEAGNSLIVTRLERIDAAANGNARVRGAIERIQRNGNTALLRVAGIAIRSRDSTTQYVGSDGETLTPAAFFQRIDEGTRITASGPDNAGQIDTARLIRIDG